MSSLTNFKLFSEIILKLLPAMTVVDLIAKTHYRFMLMLYSALVATYLFYIIYYELYKVWKQLKTYSRTCMRVFWALDFIETQTQTHTNRAL